jgi:hypothetical protein
VLWSRFDRRAWACSTTGPPASEPVGLNTDGLQSGFKAAGVDAISFQELVGHSQRGALHSKANVTFQLRQLVVKSNFSYVSMACLEILAHASTIPNAVGQMLSKVVNTMGAESLFSERWSTRILGYDLADELARWVDLPGLGYGTAPTPDGRWLVIALISVNKVGIIDLKSMTLTQTIDAPKAPPYVLKLRAMIDHAVVCLGMFNRKLYQREWL